MAAFVRTILKKPHVKPLLLNCSTFGALYGAGELTQQSKAIYYDVSFFFLKNMLRYVLGTFFDEIKSSNYLQIAIVFGLQTL